MEEQFAVSGWALVYTVLVGLNVWVVATSDGWQRGMSSGVAVVSALMAIRRIAEDAVNYLAVS